MKIERAEFDIIFNLTRRYVKSYFSNMFSKSDIEGYFNAEKSESFIFVIIGIVAIVAAAIGLIWFRSSFTKGIFWPLIVVAIIQITVGFTVYRRSDRQRIDAVYAYDMDPARLKSEEVPRMNTVMVNFQWYRWIEISLITLGFILVFVFNSNANYLFWKGVGWGLAIQASAMLIADYFAEKRGAAYLEGLKQFLKM
jgi:hypothetical protein